MAYNEIINRYWAQCIKCKKVKELKRFWESKSNPGKPSLWCKVCEKKIERERERERQAKAKAKPKPAKQPATQPTSSGVSHEFLDKLGEKFLIKKPKADRPLYVIPPSKDEGKKRLKEMGLSEKQMIEQFIQKETKALKPRVPGIFDEELGLL